MFERQPGHNPQRELWQSVLLVTLEDALLGPVQVMSQESRLRTCKAARAYLTKPSHDLEQVCTMAGFEMRAVIENMRAKIAKAPSAEELINNRRQHVPTVLYPRPPAKPKRTPFAEQQFIIQGTRRTAAEWCARFDVPLALVRSRLARNWLTERAFTITKQEAQWEAVATARQAFRRTIRPALAKKLRAPSASTPRYTHEGESLTLAQWAERAGLKKATLAKRLRNGMTLSEALASYSSTKRRPMRDLARDVSGARVHQQPGNELVGLGNMDLFAVGKAEQALIIFGGSDANDLSDCHRRGIAGSVVVQQVQLDEAHDGSPLDSETNAQPQQPSEGPGVGVNLCSLAGTGAGSTAHDFPEISFPSVTSEMTQ